MILVTLPAKMVCAEAGCSENLPVELALMATGGFAFRPSVELAKDWQVAVPPNGVFTSFCPAHKKDRQQVLTQVGPRGKRLYTVDH